MGFKGSKVQILSSRPAHKRELPQGNQQKLVPFSHCIPPKTPLPAYLQRRSSRPLRSFSTRAPQATYRDFPTLSPSRRQCSRWNPQSLCKPNKGFHPDPGLSLFETPQPRIVNARLLSQSIAAHAKPFAKRRYNQSHDDFCFIVVHCRMKSIPHSHYTM